MSFALLVHSVIGVCFLAAILYLFLLIYEEGIALFLALLVLLDCFSMVSDNFLRIPGIFRLKDLIFISTFIPLLIGIYKKDKRIKYIFGNPIAKTILTFLILVFLQILITKIRFPGESLSSVIRIGRRYFYYAIFFPALYILLNNKHFKKFKKLTIYATVFICALYIIQYIIGPACRIFSQGRIEYQVLQGVKVTRMYISGMVLSTLVLQICFMRFLLCKNTAFNIKNIFTLIMTSVQTLLTFGRAHIFGVISGTLFTLLSIKGQPRMKWLAKTSLFAILASLIYLAIFSVVFPNSANPLLAISRRVTSIFTTVANKDDTIGVRIKDNRNRIQLVKKNPVFGIGFVHDESKRFAFDRGYYSKGLRTSDSGVLTFLLDFGLLGLLYFLIMSSVVFKRGMQVYRKVNDSHLKALVLGAVSFYFGRLFSFITLVHFVRYDGIVVLSLSLVIIELANFKKE